MASAAREVPDERVMLCEGCGYILEGLPAEARCPECGKPVAESADAATRQLPLWESTPGPATFLMTSGHALFRPSHFFRHLQTRHITRLSAGFAFIWLAVCTILLSFTALGHAMWLESRSGVGLTPPQWGYLPYAVIKMFALPLIFIAFFAISRVAARLTAWEAAYRGLRLPRQVVQRGLDYHGVHLLPVCLIAWATVLGYGLLLRNGALTRSADEAYLWTLSIEVILSAGYLFFTYWAAMRNMLFANR